MKKLLALAVVILGFTAVSFGQETESVTASATIIGPISLVKDADLNFGNIAAGNLAGTVGLAASATGARSALGGVTLPAVTGSFNAAKFTVGGEGDRAIAITLPTSDIELAKGTDKMILKTFLHDAGTSPKLTSNVLVFYVGATLEVKANQPSGAYSASFDVTVNYQ